MEFIHEPVLLNEVLQWMDVRKGGVYCDGTLGGGGHSGAMLRASEGTASLYGIDRDLMERYHEGIIALSACLAGEVARRGVRRLGQRRKRQRRRQREYHEPSDQLFHLIHVDFLLFPDRPQGPFPFRWPDYSRAALKEPKMIVGLL